jgi:hypothetical protein
VHAGSDEPNVAIIREAQQMDALGFRFTHEVVNAAGPSIHDLLLSLAHGSRLVTNLGHPDGLFRRGAHQMRFEVLLERLSSSSTVGETSNRP